MTAARPAADHAPEVSSAVQEFARTIARIAAEVARAEQERGGRAA